MEKNDFSNQFMEIFCKEKIQSIFSAAPNFLIFFSDFFLYWVFFCFHFISKYKIISLKSFSVSVSWNNFYNPNGFSITFYKNQLVGVCVCRTWRRLLIVVWDSTSFRLFLHHKPLVFFYYIFINFQLGFSIFTHKSDQFHSITGKSVTHNLGVVLFILFFISRLIFLLNGWFDVVRWDDDKSCVDGGFGGGVAPKQLLFNIISYCIKIYVKNSMMAIVKFSFILLLTSNQQPTNHLSVHSHFPQFQS